MGGWTAEASATFVAALVGAVGSVTSAVLAAIEAQASRRNTKTLAQRAGWWERSSWIAERAASTDPSARRAAELMLRQVRGATWAGSDDKRAAHACPRLLKKGPNDADRVDD